MGKSFNCFARTFFVYVFFKYFIGHWGNFNHSYLGKALQLQEQHYPFLSGCAVFSCVQTLVWLPVQHYPFLSGCAVFSCVQTLVWLPVQHYPFLSGCAVFSCVRTLVWLPVLGIFNMCTDVDAYDCTQGLYRHCKRVCAGSWLWEKNPLPHWGPELVSVLHLTFQLDTLPTELSGCPELDCKSVCVKVLTLWPKLTTDWIVSLSAVTRSLAFVYCQVGKPANDGRKSCHCWGS